MFPSTRSAWGGEAISVTSVILFLVWLLHFRSSKQKRRSNLKTRTQRIRPTFIFYCLLVNASVGAVKVRADSNAVTTTGPTSTSSRSTVWRRIVDSYSNSEKKRQEQADLQRAFQEQQKHRAEKFPSEYEKARVWAEIQQEADRIKKDRSTLEAHKRYLESIPGKVIESVARIKNGILNVDKEEAAGIGLVSFIAAAGFGPDLVAEMRNVSQRAVCNYVFASLAPAFPTPNQFVAPPEAPPGLRGYLSPASDGVAVRSTSARAKEVWLVSPNHSGEQAPTTVQSETNQYRVYSDGRIARKENGGSDWHWVEKQTPEHERVSRLSREVPFVRLSQPSHLVRDSKGALALLSVTADPEITPGHGWRIPLVVELALKAPVDPQRVNRSEVTPWDKEYRFRRTGVLLSRKQDGWVEVPRRSKEYQEVARILLQLAKGYERGGANPPGEIPGPFRFAPVEAGNQEGQPSVADNVGGQSIFVEASDPARPTAPGFIPSESPETVVQPPRPTLDPNVLKNLEDFDFDALLKAE